MPVNSLARTVTRLGQFPSQGCHPDSSYLLLDRANSWSLNCADDRNLVFRVADIADEAVCYMPHDGGMRKARNMEMIRARFILPGSALAKCHKYTSSNNLRGLVLH